MLCDKDPGVMGASLHILYDMTKENKEAFKVYQGLLIDTHLYYTYYTRRTQVSHTYLCGVRTWSRVM